MTAKIQKILFALFMLMIFYSFLAAPVQALKPKVFIDAPTQEINIDETFVVTVNISDITDLYAVSFEVYYNNSVLEGLSISPNATAPMGPPDHFMIPTVGGLYVVAEGTGIWQDEGYAGLALTMTGDHPGNNGTGMLAMIKFRGKAQGLSVLNLTAVTLSNSVPERIPSATYDVTSGDVPVVPEFPLALVLPLLMVTTLAAAIIARASAKKIKEH
jgi:hypothetical protein